MGITAQPSAPSTKAPSPPMTVSPARAGSATARAVSIKGAARCSEFCQLKVSPKAPTNSSVQASVGLLPPNQTKSPKASRAAVSAPKGSSTASAEACQETDGVVIERPCA